MSDCNLREGDNLDHLRALETDSVDLIATDPPYNTGQEWRGSAGGYDDCWATREAFIGYMRERAVEMRRVLKPVTGSLYWQCDPNISPWLRLMLNDVFGEVWFEDEIVWKRTTGSREGRRFGRVLDYILHYGRDEINVDAVRHPVIADMQALYRDEHGAYRRSNPVTAPGWCKGDSGQPWRGYDPKTANRHWRAPTKMPAKVKRLLPLGYYTMSVREKLDALDKVGMLYFPPSGAFPCVKTYEDDRAGQIPSTLWDDIPFGSPSGERVGYPTQKPVALYERIVLASSQVGDVVLDPFMGSGTTGVAAARHGRRFIGIDVSPEAVRLAGRRIGEAGGTLL